MSATDRCTDGPPQGASVPLGGSALRAARERGGTKTRVVRRPVHGVLLLDKPIGLSSNDALQKAKWLLRAEKAGHTGTLDPLATGVLPICFGAATKFSQIHLDANKSYEAIAQLGMTTTTGDAEGEVIAQAAVTPEMLTAERLAAIEKQFTGKQQQLPPMHSALKKDGKALYEYARAGVEVEREARNIEVYKLKLQLVSMDTAKAAIHFIADVSKGTYIRTLGEDMGKALGCGAHLSFLRRLQTGAFSVAQAVSLAQLDAMSEAERLACLLPVDSLLAGYQTVTLDAENAGRFLSGLRRRVQLPDCEQVAVYGDAPKALLGTARIKGGELIPVRLLTPVEIGQVLEQEQASIQITETQQKSHCHSPEGGNRNMEYMPTAEEVFAYHKSTGMPLNIAKENLQKLEPVFRTRLFRAIELKKSFVLRDPIEEDAKTAHLIEQAKLDAEMKIREKGLTGKGVCHAIWREQKEILLKQHGLVWFSPSEMNPNVIFD